MPIAQILQNPLLGYQEEYQRIDGSDQRIEAIAQREIGPSCCEKMGGLLEGLANSKIFRATVVTTVAVALIFLLVSNPVGWLATALHISLFAAKSIFSAIILASLLLIQKPLEGDLIAFELSAVQRLCNRMRGHKNYDKIIQSDPGNNLGAVYLGAIPNALSDAELLHTMEGGTVISINEPWERRPKGVSVPFAGEDYQAAGIAYEEYYAKDHKIIDPEVLNEIADRIEQARRKGPVYVHCKAGISRSAAGIAAYLMKYTTLTIEQICTLIKKYRPKAKVWNKLHSLVAYHKYLVQQGYKRPPVSEQVMEAADALEQMEKRKEKPKLSKIRIQEIMTTISPEWLQYLDTNKAYLPSALVVKRKTQSIPIPTPSRKDAPRKEIAHKYHDRVAPLPPTPFPCFPATFSNCSQQTYLRRTC